VVLALPEDALYAEAAVADVRRHHVVRPAPAPSALHELKTLLEAAQRPFVLLGGGGWDRPTCERLERWVEANGLAVGTSFRCQDLFDNRSERYAGDVGIGINPELAQRIKDADVLLVVGARLGEMTSGAYTLVEAPQPKQTLVHVHAGAEELGRVYRPALAINSGMAQFVEALEKVRFERPDWREESRRLHASYLAWSKPRAIPGELQYGEIIEWLAGRLPEDTIVAGGAGNFAGWLHRHFRYKGFRTQLGSTNGSMGYGFPSALAAKLAAPDRPVLAVCGDGDFLMTGQELATAVQYAAPFVTLVVNNGLYGTIRMHQEREYPARVYGTGLTNPDFAAYARSFGAHGETVATTADFAPAFERAYACGKPALIELKIDPDAITPATTLSAIRDKARKLSSR
jgi:acetolactate synthase-1/2/3 large subunit